MKLTTRILIVVLGGVGLTSILLLFMDRHQRQPLGSAAALARGKYLVESVAICFECHSERDYSRPGWPIPPGRTGGGRILSHEGPTQLVAPNISPDESTGI